MGGARCSYRNCTIRTNGVTHMFHYPVFDKMRCHQWLTNAQRHDFLNLKVSQLKNRVVCQHHFRPDNFMNFKMDKLKFDAVPTENGPFCNAKEWEVDDLARPLPIAPDEIETDILSCKEKKATFSVKYGDFLINSEMDQKTTSELQSFSKIKPVFESISIIEEHDPPHQEVKNEGFKQIIPKSEPLNKKKIHIISEKKICTPVSLKGALKTVTPNSIIIGRDRKTDDVENMEVLFRCPTGNLVSAGSSLANLDILVNNPQTVVVPQDVPLEESPYVLLPMAQNCEQNNILVETQTTSQQNIADNSQTMQMAYLGTKNVTKETTPLKIKNDDINKISNQSQSPKSLLKNKIPPERVAAIEEKRQFNKKLRDMIEFCLDDSPVNQNSKFQESEMRENVMNSVKIMEGEKKKAIVDRTLSQQTDKVKNEKVSSFLSKESSLPSLDDYNMASLEARLKRMEDNLLLKISQNSKNILDLKNVIQSPTPVKIKKHTVATQTKEDQDTSKKQLYQEISKFLSPEANSLIYEELFLNEFGTVKYSRKRKHRQAK